MFYLILFFPLLALSSIDAEVGAYSDFIWRGTTFTENRPAIQGEIDIESNKGFYIGSFFSNAEFSDEAIHEDAKVTSEIDLTFGKRWNGEKWEIQAYYSRFSFPNAGVFDTDEWNLTGKFHSFTLELSLLDDYFGYHSRYSYVKVGHEWPYYDGLDGAISVGYNSFDRAKGNIRSRAGFETVDGAGNPDYIDVYFVNKKTFENQTVAALAFNWTNRYEYSVENGEVSKERAKDFAVVVAYILPFTL
jgi:uncharacterized protein (TIGR02001 family)